MSRSPRLRTRIALAGLLGVAACGGADAPGDAETARDATAQVSTDVATGSELDAFVPTEDDAFVATDGGALDVSTGTDARIADVGTATDARIADVGTATNARIADVGTATDARIADVGTDGSESGADSVVEYRAQAVEESADGSSCHVTDGAVSTRAVDAGTHHKMLYTQVARVAHTPGCANVWHFGVVARWRGGRTFIVGAGPLGQGMVRPR